ncbi:MAG TPA: sigma-70 family RNA polymerase sigma factor [Bryobacteraceae bacterium]|nr:sigma-70 family RNA polymerase sigma factor [Bryobacteraceae bacterium]
MDSAPVTSAAIRQTALDSGAVEQDFALRLADELWIEAQAGVFDLARGEFAQVLVAVGVKSNYGLPSGQAAGQAQMESFWRALHLQDLALASACALGRDAAWQEFLNRYKGPLTRAAMAIAGSASAGQELADSLYSEMFGIRERDGQRRSPLASYSGRGSLIGFLRASLAQRNVDRHRRTSRETPLELRDVPETPRTPEPAAELLTRVEGALRQTLERLETEERFMLSAWFLDRRTLLEISRVLRVHEATVSRRVQRLTARLHDDLLKNLEADGMSRAAAREALGVEPADLDINLRKLLQYSQAETFPGRSGPAGTDQP